MRYAVVSAASLGVLVALATGSPEGGSPEAGAGAGAAGAAGVVGAAGSGATGAVPTPSAGSTGSTGSTGSASGGSTGGSDPGDEKPIEFTVAAAENPGSLRQFYEQRLAWKDCHERQRCATARVPVDYDAPGSTTVGIALQMVPAAKPALRRGTLFINPGGPGESGVDFADEARLFFGQPVLDRYDIVGFDPRGLGKSGGFECLTDRDLDAMYAADPTPDSPEEAAALSKAASARAAGCLRRGRTLAATMGTESVVKDLDILREAVGDERLNYYGVSYGTLIGAIYADTFSTRVGLMVLDSAVVPDGFDGEQPTQSDIDADARGAAYEFDDVFDDFVTACTEDGDCPLGADTKKASATLVALLDRLDRTPLKTDAGLPALTEGWASTAVMQGLYEPESWPDLVNGLRDALESADGTELAWFGMSFVGRDEDGTYLRPSFERDSLPITCADWPDTVWDTMPPSAAVLKNHPLWARVAQYTVARCAGWQVRPRQNVFIDADLNTPVVVIGNTDDPVTPIEGTEYLADLIVGSRFVTVNAEGHGSYGEGNRCADRVVERYLAEAIAPEDGLKCGSD